MSIIIPTFKVLDQIPKTLKKLKFKGKFEIIIAGDSLSKKDITFLKKQKIKLSLSDERRGKVTALNEASKMAKGKLLVFLDSDTQPENSSFLKTLWENYKIYKFDIGTGRLMINGTSFLEKVVAIDYLFINSMLYLGNVFERPRPVNGAFFIIKRSCFEQIGGFHKEILEDFGIGYRARMNRMNFHYMKNLTVFTSSPQKMKHWLTQRKRWMAGGSESLKSSRNNILRELPSSLTSITLTYPLFFFGLFTTLALFLTSSKINPFYIVSITIFLTSTLMLILNKLLDWGTTPKSGLIYLFIYGPISSFLLFLMVILSFFRKKELTDWKV